MSIKNEPIRTTTGTYAGSDAANRAIPHGLGVIPKFVRITNIASPNCFYLMGGIDAVINDLTATHAVTALDTTNFYVGNAANYGQSANAAGVNYQWVAWG